MRFLRRLRRAQAVQQHIQVSVQVALLLQLSCSQQAKEWPHTESITRGASGHVHHMVYVDLAELAGVIPRSSTRRNMEWARRITSS